MDHTKDSLIEALHLNEEEFEKITSILATLGQESVADVADKIDSEKTEQTIYHVSTFLYKMLAESLTSSFDKFLVDLTEKENVAIDEQEIKKSINIIVGFLNNAPKETDDQKLSLMLIPILFLGATGLIPLSFCIDLIAQISKFFKFSTIDLIRSIGTLGEFLDPLLEVPKNQSVN